MDTRTRTLIVNALNENQRAQRAMATSRDTFGDPYFAPSGPPAGGGGGRAENPKVDELRPGEEEDWLAWVRKKLYEGGMTHDAIDTALGGPSSRLPWELGMLDVPPLMALKVPFYLDKAERARQHGEGVEQALETVAAIPFMGPALKGAKQAIKPVAAGIREVIELLAPKAGKRVVERTVGRQSAEEIAKQRAAADAFLHGREHPINRVGGSLYEAPPITGLAKTPTKHDYDILEIPSLDEIQASAMRNPLERSPTSVYGLPPYSGVPVDQSGIDALLAEAKAVREGGKLPAIRMAGGRDMNTDEVNRLAQEMGDLTREIDQLDRPRGVANENLPAQGTGRDAVYTGPEYEPPPRVNPVEGGNVRDVFTPEELEALRRAERNTPQPGIDRPQDWEDAELNFPWNSLDRQAQADQALSDQALLSDLEGWDPRWGAGPGHPAAIAEGEYPKYLMGGDTPLEQTMPEGEHPMREWFQNAERDAPKTAEAAQAQIAEELSRWRERDATGTLPSPPEDWILNMPGGDKLPKERVAKSLRNRDPTHPAHTQPMKWSSAADKMMIGDITDYMKMRQGFPPSLVKDDLELPAIQPKVREAVKSSRYVRPEKPMRVFTGTAADPFERFDPEKVGIGEGGEQTLDEGWGTYMNPLPPVARHYGEQNATLEDRATRAGRAMALDVWATPDDFLDIKAKFSELPADAQAAIQKRVDDWITATPSSARYPYGQEMGTLENNWQAALHRTFDAPGPVPGWPGEGRALGNKRRAAEWLRDELGYKGFKYPDSGTDDLSGQLKSAQTDVDWFRQWIDQAKAGKTSKPVSPEDIRNAEVSLGEREKKLADLQARAQRESTYNYVVNDPSIIDIVNQDIGLKAPVGADQINEIMRQLSGEVPGAPAGWQGPSPNRSTGVPRYVSPKGTSPRMQRLQDKFANDPAIAAELNRLIDAGGDIGRNWYNAEAIRDMFIAAQGNSPAKGHQAWTDFIDRVAATSTGSKVPKNIDIAMDYMGRTTPKASSNLTRKEVAQRMADEMSAGLFRPSEGAGSKTQRNHQWNIESILRGDWEDATAEPRLNPKPRGYRGGFMGDPDAIAADMHYTRLMAMLSDDPAWLALNGEIGDDFAENLIKQFPDAGQYIERGADKTGAFHTMFRARDAVNNGAVPFEAIKTDPQVWEAMPADAEYGPLEEIMKTQAHGRGLTGYQGQAGLWIGAADKTGVDPTSRQTFVNIFVDRVNEASRKTGVPVEEIVAHLAQSGEMRWAERGLGAVEMPHEQTPLTTSGHLTGAADDSLTAKREFAKERSWKDKSTGRDILTQAAGMPTAETMPGMGVWTPQGGKTEFNAVETARPLVPLTDAGLEGATIDPAALDMLEQVSAVRGLIDVQGGEAYFRLFPGNDPATANSILIPLNRPLSKNEAAALNGVVQKYGLDAMSDTGRSTTMMSFDPAMNAGQLREKLDTGAAADIQAAVPSAGEAVPATRVGDMYSLENELAAANQGTGAASTKVAQRVSPETARAITQSEWWPSIKDRLIRQNEADRAYAKATGRPLRQDVIRMRKFMADHGLDKFLAKVLKTGGKGFPVVLGLGVVNEVLQELEREQGTSPDG